VVVHSDHLGGVPRRGLLCNQKKHTPQWGIFEKGPDAPTFKKIPTETT